jgi:hypothetical protein
MVFCTSTSTCTDCVCWTSKKIPFVIMFYVSVFEVYGFMLTSGRACRNMYNVVVEFWKSYMVLHVILFVVRVLLITRMKVATSGLFFHWDSHGTGTSTSIKKSATSDSFLRKNGLRVRVLVLLVVLVQGLHLLNIKKDTVCCHVLRFCIQWSMAVCRQLVEFAARCTM